MNLIDEKYEVLHRIKEGGMGTIYKVRHRLLDEIRVVKVMRPQASASEDLRRRFVREARMAIRVRHTNIGQLYDFSIDSEGSAIIVMEFIDGATVQEILACGPPPSTPFTVDIAVQVLEALSCLHSNGIVHRDIASDNVMIARGFDGRPVAKVIDLGIAKDPTGDAATATVTGIFLGKARYAAPEQFQGGSQGPSPATDLYSFGVFLYEMLTGRLPYDGAMFAELAAGHLFNKPLPFSDTDPDGRVPEGLREAVLHALEKDPGDRIASAGEFAARIRPFASPAGPDARELEEHLQRVRSAGAGAPQAAPVASSHAAAPSESREAPVWDAGVETMVDMLLAHGLARPELQILDALHDYRRQSGGDTAVAAMQPVRQDTAPSPPPMPAPATDRQETERWEPRVHPRQRPRDRPRALPRRERREDRRLPSIVLWLMLAVPLLLAGAWLVWMNVRDAPPPRPLYAEQIAMALALPTDSTAAIEMKLKRLSSLIDLLPGAEVREAHLEREKGRLINLQELHRQLDRLLDLETKASSGGGLETQDLEGVSLVWSYIREARERLTGDDPDGRRIEDAARAALRRIAATTGAESLRDLAETR